MDYNHSFDSREHDSGYFTPSPDKDNKIVDSNTNYLKLESNNNNNVYTNKSKPASQESVYHKTDISNDGGGMLGANNLDTSLKGGMTAMPGGKCVSDVDRPPHSYIALISMAILSKADRKILLNEIYDWVIHNFPYYQFRTDKSWRNSIRHNLSLNECFIKVGKAGNGRGYYWSIHSANMTDFKKGDFRRRQARLRAKHDKSTVSSSTTSSTTTSKTFQTADKDSKRQEKQSNINKLDLNSPTTLTNDETNKLNKSPAEASLNPYYHDYHYQAYNSNLTASPISIQKCYDYSTNLNNHTFNNNNINSSSNSLLNSHDYSTMNGFNMYGNQSFGFENTQQQQQQTSNCFTYGYGQAYTDGYSQAFAVDAEAEGKYGALGSNVNQYSDNSLLMKASPTQLSSSANKYSSASLSASPSSSSPTSSTSSTNYYYNAYNSTQSQPPLTPLSTVSSTSTSSSPILNSQLNTQQTSNTNNQYSSVGSTFPWLHNSNASQHANSAIRNVHFPETFSSAATTTATNVCPTYDSSSFSYNHRI